jgi:hypothetical protein
MLRRCVSAAVVLFVLCGFVVAETGVITAVDTEKNELTVKVGKKGDAKDVTVKLAKTVKFMVKEGKDGTPEPNDKMTLKKLAKQVEKASKAEKGPKGVFAKIDTEGDTTTITMMKGKGKGK